MSNERNYNKLVSVVMPAFNAENFIAAAITSALEQTYDTIELIVVDDASTDNTLELIKLHLNDSRVKLLELSTNRGVAHARNCAIEEAQGNYIAFLDADDIWMSRKVEKQVDLLSTRNIHCSHTYYQRFSDPNSSGQLIKSPTLVSNTMMRASNRIGNSSGMYNCKELGKFYQSPRGHEDYAMWLEITRRTDSICVPEPLMKYRVTPKSLSSNILRGAKWHWQILRDCESMSRLQASYFMIQYAAHACIKRI